MMEVIGCKECTVVVMGRTGAGKSSLINSLLCDRSAVKAARGAGPVTQQPECMKMEINGLNFLIWDTPGLFDKAGRGDHYMRDMKEKIGEFHLVLLAIEVRDSVRFEHSDREVMKLLYAEFGRAIFQNMVVVFTKANLLLDRLVDDVRTGKLTGTDPHDEQYRLIEELKSQWKAALDDVVCSSIDLPMLPAAEINFNQDKPLPVGNRYHRWYANLWKACLAMANDKAALTFIELARRQGRFRTPRPRPKSLQLGGEALNLPGSPSSRKVPVPLPRKLKPGSGSFSYTNPSPSSAPSSPMTSSPSSPMTSHASPASPKTTSTTPAATPEKGSCKTVSRGPAVPMADAKIWARILKTFLERRDKLKGPLANAAKFGMKGLIWVAKQAFDFF